MKLKTAILTAIICITFHFAISVLLLHLEPILSKLFYFINILLLDGSIVLFLWVLYFNQIKLYDGIAIDNDKNIIPIIKTAEQATNLTKDKYQDTETNARKDHKKNLSYIALAAFTIGILSIPFAFLSFVFDVILIPFGLSVLCAPVLGFIALIQISLNKNNLRGRLIAITGICLTLISIICFLSYFITHFDLPV